MPEWIFDPCSSIYDKNSAKICPKQIVGYINFTIKNFIAIIRLLKANNLFVAIYFPVMYQLRFSKKRNTLYTIACCLLILIVIHSPLLLGMLVLRLARFEIRDKSFSNHHGIVRFRP
jgi:hypothetical protein